jgi:hypothetical protein
MFTPVPTDISERIADLEERILDARRLAWNASQMGDAAGFGRIDRILDALYAERDGLADRYPEEAAHGRVIAARRRAGVPGRAA